jgi:hypothetical protein
MEPRRLTDGSLANTNNAWGQAALEQATSSSGAGQARANSKMGTADASSPSSVAPDRADSSRSDWYLPSSMSGVSSGGGWLSRPTTGAAAVTASRATPAAAGSPLPGDPSSPAVPGELGTISACAVSKGCCLGLPAAQCARSVQPGCLLDTASHPSKPFCSAQTSLIFTSCQPKISSGMTQLPPVALLSAGLLPRIRTPDSAAAGGRPSSSGGPPGSLPAMASYSAALLDLGGSVSSSTAAGGPGSTASRSPTASASRVAFRDGPGGPASSAARSGSALKKPSSGKARMGQ